MKITFPYPKAEPLKIPNGYKAQVFDLPDITFKTTGSDAVRRALTEPIKSKQLGELASGKKRILLVADDVSRPTPIHEFIHFVLDELATAGVSDDQIEFIMALGTHRYMTKDEITKDDFRDYVAIIDDGNVIKSFNSKFDIRRLK